MASAPRTPTNTGARLGNRQLNLPTGNKNVEALLLWRDPLRSGLALAGITVAYILLEWSHLSLLKIVSHSLLAAVTLSFLWNNIASFTNRPGVPIPHVLRQGVSENQLREFAETAVGPLNRLFAVIKRVISGEEVTLSVQVAVCLYVFGRLGNYFSSLALVYILVLLAFSLPKLYEENRDSIDSGLSSVSKQLKTNYKQYAEPYVQKIPRASTSTANSGSTIGTRQNANTNNSTADSFGTGTGTGTGPQRRNFEGTGPQPQSTYQ